MYMKCRCCPSDLASTPTHAVKTLQKVLRALGFCLADWLRKELLDSVQEGPRRRQALVELLAVLRDQKVHVGMYGRGCVTTAAVLQVGERL